MMADFVTPRHSAVMERLRRRIELFRQHHNSCEGRYADAAAERLELERQHTLGLHQRLLQNKAKRASKHRQPHPSAEQDGQRAAESAAAEQSRSNTRAVLHEAVKRKMESGDSPLSNGLPDGVASSKKACLENGATADPKLRLADRSANGTHRPAGEAADVGVEPDFHQNPNQKEMKQEPEDILPIMPPSVAGNSGLFLDLNLNEQEWTELMEELNCSVAIEDIQDILNYGFEDRRDPLEPGGAGVTGAQLQDVSSVKAEFPPAFEQDVRCGSSGPPLPTSSPVASSPALPPQSAPPPRQLQAPPAILLSQGPPSSKDLSPAQQLQHLAAQKQRAQVKMPQKPPQPGAKFHGQGPHGPPPWAQMANSSQSSLGNSFGMDKPGSPALYPSDFSAGAQKQLLMPGKGSPKAGGGAGYMSGPTGPPNMLGHLSSGPPLSHAPAGVLLNYKNTIPLSHYEAGPGGPGPPRPPNNQNQDKVALLNLIRQKNSMNYRQHPQDQSFSSSTNAIASGAGNNPMAVAQGLNAMAGNHCNAALRRDQMVALKQQQMLEQQKKQQFMQRQLLAEQEKQRQQDQQLQRHLTRPPPQYQDQPGPFPQQSVGPFTAPSQPMSSIGSMGGPAPTSRMFPQNQGMLGMKMAQVGGPGGTVAPPTAVSQADISHPPCVGGGGGASVDAIYNNLSLQHQPLGPMSAPYRTLQQPNAAMLKQQLADGRMPSTMQGGMGGAMQAGQGGVWRQAPPSNGPTLHPNAFSNGAFHMQQPRIPKMAAGSASFGGGSGGRALMQTNMAPQQRAAPAAPGMSQQQTQPPATQNSAVLSELAAFGQPQAGGRQAMACNQGYQVSRTATQQQQVSFGYNAAAGSFAAESELVDSLLKAQSTQEWMADLDELLASHQ